MCLVAAHDRTIDLQFDNGGTRDAVYTAIKAFCPKSQIQWKKFASSPNGNSRRRVAKVLAGGAARSAAYGW